MMKSIYIPIAFFVLTFTFLLRGEDITSCEQCCIGQKPSWVKEIPFSPAFLPAISSRCLNTDNVQCLLLNKQHELDQKEDYIECAFLLCNSMAVEELSNLSLEFDPAYESLTLHQLGIYRDGQWVEKTNTSHMQIVQQEIDIAKYLYGGKKTWCIFMKDVRPGDIIKYSYTKKGQNPLFKDHFTCKVDQQYSIPMDKIFFRILGSDHHKLQIKRYNNAVLPSYQKGENGNQEWIWEGQNTSESEMDPFTPHWYFNESYLFITDCHSWKEVAVWGTTLFHKPSYHSEEMKNLINHWTFSSTSEEEKILKALRFVQDEIRYMGFEDGIGSHQPRDPNMVLSQRFGDCKDKTLLLITLLDLMGVQTHPVFVCTNFQEHIADFLPSSQLFDHVIVQIDLGEHSLWVDPTCSFQGGDLTTTFCPPYGKGLVLDSATEGLSDQPNVAFNSLFHQQAILQVRDHPEDCFLQVKVVCHGNEADEYRRIFANDSLKNQTKNILTALSSNFGDLSEGTPLKIEDDRENNIITITASCKFNDFWNQENNTKWYECNFMGFLGERDLSIKRKDPLKIPFPKHVIKEIQIIDFTNNQAPCIEHNWADIPIHTVGGLTFSQSQEKTDRGIHLRREFVIEKDHLLPNELAMNRQFFKKIQKDTEIKITNPNFSR